MTKGIVQVLHPDAQEPENAPGWLAEEVGLDNTEGAGAIEGIVVLVFRENKTTDIRFGTLSRQDLAYAGAMLVRRATEID